MSFAEFIRGLDMRAKDLAALVDVDPSNIAQWKKGHEPTDTNLVRLARGLGLPVAEVARHCQRWQDPSPRRRGRWQLGLERAEVARLLGVTDLRVRYLEDERPDVERQVRELYGMTDRPATRPATPFPYPGSKTAHAPELRALLPAGDVYVEPFGGAAAVLLSADVPFAPREVVNDLDGDIVNLLRVLRDPAGAEELQRRLTLTPYAREEYDSAAGLSRSEEGEAIDRAWATFVVVGQGFNSSSRPGLSGWSSRNAGWSRRVAWVGSWHERLANVTLEHDTASAVIERYDSPSTVFYLDPPYHPATRSNLALYRYEMNSRAHADLLDQLVEVRGSIVLSGYAHPSYDRLEQAGWEAHEFGKREQAWTNPACSAPRL